MKFQLFVGAQIYSVLSEKQINHITEFVKAASVYKITSLHEYIPNRNTDLRVFVLFDEYCLDFQNEKFGRPVVIGALYDGVILYDTKMKEHQLADITTNDEMQTKQIDPKQFIRLKTSLLWNFSRDKSTNADGVEKYKGWGKKWLDILNIKFKTNIALVPFNEKLYEYYRTVGFSNLENCVYHDHSSLHNRYMQVLVRVSSCTC
jgi:hypothetical protein